jgi:hypothetical protein
MAGFGSLFVYTFTVFVKPLSAQFGWNRESISLGFAIAAMTVGLSLTSDWSLNRSRWPSKNHPSLHDGVCLWCRLASIASFPFMAVLSNVFRDRHCWKWRSPPGICALYFHMVSKTVGNGAGVRNARSRFGAMILPLIAQAIVTQSGWRTAYLSLGLLALFLGLPLSWRYIIERGPIQEEKEARSCGALWTYLAARDAVFCLLDHCSCSLRRFNQHEWSHYAPVGIAHRSRNYSGRCGFVRFHTWWVKCARQDWNGLAARPIFWRARVAFVVTLISAGGVFFLARAAVLPQGFAAALIALEQAAKPPSHRTC